MPGLIATIAPLFPKIADQLGVREDVVFSRWTGGTIDPVTRTMVGRSLVEVSTKAVPKMADFKAVQDQRVHWGDLGLVMEPSVDVQEGDDAVIATGPYAGKYSVIVIKPLLRVAQEAWVRGGA